MKKLILLIGVILATSNIYSQIYYNPNYTVGVPVNDSIPVFEFRSYEDCKGVFTKDFYFTIDTTVSGLKFFLVVDSLSGTISIPPFGILKTGDTLPIPATSYLIYMSYPGYLHLTARITGVPEIADEEYSCDELRAYFGLSTCFNPEHSDFQSTCAVQLSSSIGHVELINYGMIISNGMLSFNSDKGEMQYLGIYNYAGQQIINANYNFKNPLSLSALSTGIYFIQIRLKDNRTTTYKFFKD